MANVTIKSYIYGNIIVHNGKKFKKTITIYPIFTMLFSFAATATARLSDKNPINIIDIISVITMSIFMSMVFIY